MTTEAPQVPSMPDKRAVSFREAVRYWLKLGFVSFGGPAGQISLMHQELVERRRWIGERRFLHALNYTMVLPGPEAQQLATYIGWLLHGTWGGIVAGSLFVLPSLLMLMAYVYLVYGEVTLVASVLYGIKPAVTAIVAFAAYRIGSRALNNGLLWSLALVAFGAIFVFDIPFPRLLSGRRLSATRADISNRMRLSPAPVTRAPIRAMAPRSSMTIPCCRTMPDSAGGERFVSPWWDLAFGLACSS